MFFPNQSYVMYITLSLSHIRYGDVVWGTISSSELQALQSLQNRALSIIDRARFQDLWPKKWLSVRNLIRFDRCVMVYNTAIKANEEYVQTEMLYIKL